MQRKESSSPPPPPSSQRRRRAAPAAAAREAPRAPFRGRRPRHPSGLAPAPHRCRAKSRGAWPAPPRSRAAEGLLRPRQRARRHGNRASAAAMARSRRSAAAEKTLSSCPLSTFTKNWLLGVGVAAGSSKPSQMRHANINELLLTKGKLLSVEQGHSVLKIDARCRLVAPTAAHRCQAQIT